MPKCSHEAMSVLFNDHISQYFSRLDKRSSQAFSKRLFFIQENPVNPTRMCIVSLLFHHVLNAIIVDWNRVSISLIILHLAFRSDLNTIDLSE